MIVNSYHFYSIRILRYWVLFLHKILKTTMVLYKCFLNLILTLIVLFYLLSYLSMLTVETYQSTFCIFYFTQISVESQVYLRKKTIIFFKIYLSGTYFFTQQSSGDKKSFFFFICISSRRIAFIYCIKSFKLTVNNINRPLVRECVYGL